MKKLIILPDGSTIFSKSKNKNNKQWGKKNHYYKNFFSDQRKNYQKISFETRFTYKK